jgi:hypothetical protein
MGDVVHVNFGTEREWSETLEKLKSCLISVGALFGDDAVLMVRKAEATCAVLRVLVEKVPTLHLTTQLPEDLTPEQLELTTIALKRAALAGIEVMMTHTVATLMQNIHDLCTSKLKT